MSKSYSKVVGAKEVDINELHRGCNFSKRWRMFVSQELFGIKVGDFEGKLSNSRVLAEFNITRRFGIGGGFERYRFEVDAEDDDFIGQLDTSYTGLTLYLKGQF